MFSGPATLHPEQLPAIIEPDPRAAISVQQSLLQALGICDELEAKLKMRAAANGTQFHDELLVSGIVTEWDYYTQLAALLDLPIMTYINPERIFLSERNAGTLLRARSKPGLLLYRGKGGRNSILISPRHSSLDALIVHLCQYPGLRARICIAPPSAIRRAIIERGQERFLNTSINLLSLEFSRFSAKTVVNAWQGAMLGAIVVALPACLLIYPWQTTIALHFVFSVFFLSCVYLRMTAAAIRPAKKYNPLDHVDWQKAPVYSVLVPLYQESDIVQDLIGALSAIVWPRSKLEVKLVCEADDTETLSALSECSLYPWIEIVTVPPSYPRTKPKALNYALQFATGELVTVFDAEDRPHPYQLIEAWQCFTKSPADLACLQAPLVVSNYDASDFARLFAFEYAALFRGILPWLSRAGRIFPLGGTSNHFKRSALEKAGAWDPYNVTEDADIGIRLFRFGYRIATISRPTFEDAPETFGIWLKQRTRWYKGWFQTWLVHNRSPFAFLHETGGASFLLAQILFSGMIISALVHPLFLIAIVGITFKVLAISELRMIEVLLFSVDTFNIVLAYAAYLLLGYRTLVSVEKKKFARIAVCTPAYWLAISLASWRAVYQIVREPFLWEKTPHKPRRRCSA